ncbi:MAG TPA: hypothetical protein PK668_01160 [Myxococcota bacterium]|nr:hypothetical protein [Myxococcota bacterium]HRY96710.1 hypothetical protein [Myxococcota bacterium]HSA20202.1 hypothetical protein [Myxococcota bacterium]
MNTRIISLLSILWLAPAALLAQEAQPPGEPAPLALAADDKAVIEFQIGADVMAGFGLGDAELVAGVNAMFLYPVLDWLNVGIRPSLHYILPETSPYDVTWMHADVALGFDFLEDPVRVYGLLAGGYAFANNTDTYVALAHGGSGLAAVGVAWRSESNWGVFAELGFRVGQASHDKTRCSLDDAGEPIMDEDSLTCVRETYTNTFELYAFTVNFGITISP